MDKTDLKKTRVKKNSMTQKLLEEIGEKRLQELWVKYGMYKSADLLSVELQQYVSSSTIRYLSQIRNWRRNINKLSPIYKGYLAGNIDPRRYKQLIFPTEGNNNG